MSELTNETIRILLAAAGLPSSAAEINGHATKYPNFRAAVDALYAVPAARYAVPATRFDAQPSGPGWEQ